MVDNNDGLGQDYNDLVMTSDDMRGVIGSVIRDNSCN